MVVADAAQGISDPTALTFAEGRYGGGLFVVSSGSSVLHRIDVATGETTAFASGPSWGPVPPTKITTIAWDDADAIDGALYVGDQGSDFDGDASVYRVAPDGTASVVIRGPGPGLDDIYGLTISRPGTPYPVGIYVAGDTDVIGAPDWGLIAGGTVTAFSELAGVEGAAFDPTGAYGGSLWTSRPNGGGYAGDDAISPVGVEGTAGTPILTGEPGVHAVTFSQRGTFGARMYAASWSSDTIIEVAPDGTRTVLASGLLLDNLNGNILAVSSDGEVMFVADRLADRVVCIEPL